MASRFEINEILKNPNLDLKNTIRDNIYPSDDDTFYVDDSIICSRMDSNYYELDQFISLQGSRRMRYTYSAVRINIRRLPDKVIKLNLFLARLEDSKIKFEFLLLCNTLLTDTNFDLYNIAGFKVVYKNRQQMKGDGVGMYGLLGNT